MFFVFFKQSNIFIATGNTHLWNYVSQRVWLNIVNCQKCACNRVVKASEGFLWHTPHTHTPASLRGFEMAAFDTDCCDNKAQLHERRPCHLKDSMKGIWLGQCLTTHIEIHFDDVSPSLCALPNPWSFQNLPEYTLNPFAQFTGTSFFLRERDLNFLFMKLAKTTILLNWLEDIHTSKSLWCWPCIQDRLYINTAALSSNHHKSF